MTSESFVSHIDVYKSKWCFAYFHGSSTTMRRLFNDNNNDDKQLKAVSCINICLTDESGPIQRLVKDIDFIKLFLQQPSG